MRHFKFASTWPKPDVNPLKIVRKKSKLLKSKMAGRACHQNLFFSEGPPGNGGARRDRTADLLRAKQALSHLSYGPLASLFSACRLIPLVPLSNVPICTRLRSSRAIRRQSKKILRQASRETSASRSELLLSSLASTPRTQFCVGRSIATAKHSLLCEPEGSDEIRKIGGSGKI